LGKDAIKTFGPGATRAVINKTDGWVFPTQSASRNVQQATTAAINNPNAARILAGGGGV